MTSHIPTQIIHDQPARHYRIRWAFLLLFIGGYIASFSYFEEFIVSYTTLTLISFLSCCFILSRLNRPLNQTLPIWVIFILFMVGYYFKFYWIILAPDTVEDLLLPNFRIFSPDVCISAYATATCAFTGFCLVSWLLLGRLLTFRPHLTNNKRTSDFIRPASRYVSGVLMVTIPFLMLFTTLLMHKFNIGVMGTEDIYLPFRTAGLIFYTRIAIIPGLLLVLIWSNIQIGRRKQTAYAVALLFLHGLTDMVLRTSRGGLATLLLSLGLLFLTSDQRIRRPHWLFILCSVFLVILLYPLVSTYRYLRISNPESIITPLSDSLADYINGAWTFGEILTIGAKTILFRMTGMDILLGIAKMDVKPLWWDVWELITDPRGIAEFVTVNVFGYSKYDVMSIAPSIIGWFYIIGGNVFVVLGTIGFTMFTLIIWRMLAIIKFRTLPIAQALFLTFLFLNAMEGHLEGIAFQFVVTIISILVAEGVLRFIARGHRVLVTRGVITSRTSFQFSESK